MPVLKQGSHMLSTNYRPFSVLSPFSPPSPAFASLACLSRVYFSRYPQSRELAHRLLCYTCILTIYSTFLFDLIYYLQMADFPFPLASFILKCAVDNISLYFLTHKIIRKNLKTKKTKFLKYIKSNSYG